MFLYGQVSIDFDIWTVSLWTGINRFQNLDAEKLPEFHATATSCDRTIIIVEIHVAEEFGPLSNIGLFFVRHNAWLVNSSRARCSEQAHC